MATDEPMHPLAQLSEQEFRKARDVITSSHGPDESLFFRSIYLHEPAKAELVPFLELEHAGKITDSTPWPPRVAKVEYDVVKDGELTYIGALVNIKTGEALNKVAAGRKQQSYFTAAEFKTLQDICMASDMFQDAMSEFALPEGFNVTIDPWPYGGPDDDSEDLPRYMQGLVFARDATTDNLDANHYAYPIPIIPVMDWLTKKIIRVDRLATGGKEDGLLPAPRGSSPKELFRNKKAADYVPELIKEPMRSGLKPLNVVQPDGASFSIHPDGLVQWQKWRFRLGFTPREGAVLHDVCYDNRPILYRLSYSELTVPYADPRPPFQRKHAFDLGDGGIGRTANNLELGCDCLGAIHYVDSLLAEPDGSPSPAKSVVCLHEQDNGVLWKHTNFRTDRAVVTRNRELVVQFIVTLANYEYVLAYKMDLAGGITVETRATGIMSVVSIDEGKTSSYGNVVAPEILAQNHQHLFAVRIDPAIDSYADGDGRVVVEESVGRKRNEKTNPYGNLYEIQRQVIEKATWIDAEPRVNRTIKFENANKKNDISGKNVGFKLVAPMTQMLLADDDGLAARRAPFAKHHTWVTGYRDGELWAAGEFTSQNREEEGGVSDMVRRGDWFTETNESGENGAREENSRGANGVGKARRSSPVVWSVFGLTHNPRVEDWPVMPVEIHQMHLRPTDFFTSNPALNVPSNRNTSSVLVPCCGGEGTRDGVDATGTENGVASVQQDPVRHLQGDGEGVTASMAGANISES